MNSNENNDQNIISTKLIPAATGINGHDVFDCSGSPKDIRPALTAIMQRVEKEFNRLKDGQKLVILYGEDHSSDADHFLKAVISKKLNEFFNGYFQISLESASQSEKGEGIESLTTNYNSSASSYFAQSILTQKIPILKSDTPAKKGVYHPEIDQSVPEVRKFISDNFPQYLDKVLPVVLSAGIEVRNSFMVDQVITSGIDVTFFPVGELHIMGAFNDDPILAFEQEMKLEDGEISEDKMQDTREDILYSKSLCAAFSKVHNPPRILSIIQLGTKPEDNKYVLEKAEENQNPILFLEGLDATVTLNELWIESGKEGGVGLPDPNLIQNKSGNKNPSP